MTREISPEEKLLKLIKAKETRPKLNTKASEFSFTNKILIAAIIFLSGYLFFTFVLGNKNKNERKILKQSRLLNGQEKKAEAISVPDNSLETAISQEKDIFGSNTHTLISQNNDNLELDLGLQDKVSRQFVLVGIMGQNEAVIEDRQSHKTYFLHKDEKFLGFKVKDIKSDKVVLEYNGQEVELVL